MGEDIYEKTKEAFSAIGKVNADMVRMIDAKCGEDMRNWYSEALQDLWSLFNVVNSHLLDEGKG